MILHLDIIARNEGAGMIRSVALGLTLTLALAGRGQAQTPLASAWQAIARADVDAALALVGESHPGAAPELGDIQFQQRLAQARQHAEARLPKVADVDGYNALMAGLANDFGDGHIWSSALYPASRRRWAGMVVVKRGGDWVVAAQQAAAGEPALKDALIESCDGVPVDRLATDRIGQFSANPAIGAAMAKKAPLLLLDDRNPFVPLLKSCRFQLNGAPIDHALQWRTVAARDLEKAVIEASPPSTAGMGISDFAGGKWIAIESLDPSAAAVVDAVEAQLPALRVAPMVVIDLRGNGGGNSNYTTQIARLLVGEKRIAPLLGKTAACGGMYWRASPGNAEALLAFAAARAKDGGGRADGWAGQAEGLRQALTTGQRFYPALPACASKSGVAPPPPPPERLAPSMMRGRLVLVTDRYCFSSCLIATEQFRQLGALHVGETTDAATRYMEVREIRLPSGLRTFSTLQKVAIGSSDYGPFAPAIVYPGALSDSAALKAWVASLPH